MMSPIFAAGGPWIVDANTIVMVALIIFLFIAFRMGWPMIRDMLDARIDEVRSELFEAQTLREEAQTLLSEYTKKHEQALSEAEAIVASAKEDAAALRAKAEADLKDSLKRREAAAKARIAQAEIAAVAEAQARAAASAIDAAEKMLADKMDAETDGKLIDDAIGLVQGRLH